MPPDGYDNQSTPPVPPPPGLPPLQPRKTWTVYVGVDYTFDDVIEGFGFLNGVFVFERITGQVYGVDVALHGMIQIDPN